MHYAFNICLFFTISRAQTKCKDENENENGKINNEKSHIYIFDRQESAQCTQNVLHTEHPW